MTITILTLVIGADYIKGLEKCLVTKKSYAEKHNYNYIQGGAEFWDRTRPISWSKIPFLLKVLSDLPDGAIVWLSDADVAITNPSYTIEEHILPLFPANKDMLMTRDACGNINAGNILMRNTPWLRDFWKRVSDQKQFTYHIWWENAAILHFYNTSPSDRNMIEVTTKHKVFNAYLRGLEGEPLWEPGDFLVHYAGVYDIKRMAELTDLCLAGKTPRIPM